MDELIFRSSQKLENLQIQLGLVAQQSKILFHQCSENGVRFASEAWRSPKVQNLGEAIKNMITWLVEMTDRSTEKILEAVDAIKLYDGLYRIFRNEITRRHFYWACAGFVAGCFVGYSIASTFWKPAIAVTNMKAVVCTNYQGYEFATVIDDVPVPRIEEPDDILVQVQASSISLLDVDVCRGYGRRLRKLLNSRKTEFPIVLGRSCSGVVVEIGRDVERFEIGDPIVASSPFWSAGLSSEYALVKEHRTAHMPKRIGFEGAAGLPYSGSIALMAVQSANLSLTNAPDKRVLVFGACTPVGCIIVQYCRHLGADVTAVTDIAAAPVADGLGASDIIILQQENTPGKSDAEADMMKLLLKELELRDPFDAIFITKEVELSRSTLMKFCRSNGQVFYTLPDYLRSDNFGFFLSCIFWTYFRLKCFFMNILGRARDGFGEPEMNHLYLENLNKLIDANEMQSVVDKVFYVLDADQALEHVQSSGSIGTTIVTFR